MKLLLSILLFLISCDSTSNEEYKLLLNQPENKYFKKYQIFDDNNYLLILTTIDTSNNFGIGEPTVILKLLKNGFNQLDTLICDSLISRNPLGAKTEIAVEFIDFNFDGVKDVVIPYGTDPRGNNGVHLYLVDEKNKTVKYMEKFNEIGNPKPDSINNLIQSFVLSGPPFCKFYEINSKSEVKDLGNYIEFSDDEKNIDSLIKKEIEKIKLNKQIETDVQIK